jgi:alpha-tubulin suppressor-like RCC1 family protein
MRRHVVVTVGLMAGVVAIAGCGERATAPGRVVARVLVTPTSISLHRDSSYQLTAVAEDSTGAPIPGAGITWSGSNPAVRVSATGLVTGVTANVASVEASAGGQAGYAEVLVYAGRASIRLLADSLTLNPGGATKLVAEVFDSLGFAAIVRQAEWSSSDTTVATVEASGTVRARKVGTTVVSARSVPLTASDSVVVRSVVASVKIVPDTMTLVIGQALQLAVVARDSAGAVVTGRPVVWSTCCGGAVAVSSSGLVKAAAGGSTGVVASIGPVSDTATIRSRVDDAFRTVSAGYVHTCAATTAGTPYCWGNGWYGQLGTGLNYVGGVPAPTAVAGGLQFQSVATYGDESCGLTSAGDAYCWGSDGSGTLGNESDVAPCIYGSPCRGTALPAAAPLSFRALALGGGHVCGLTVAGAAYCWGILGELGADSTGFTTQYTPLAVVGGRTFTAISAGSDHTCALAATGAVYCWGRNEFGQLGTGAMDSLWHTAPDSALGPAWAGLAVEQYASCALTSLGAVYCWGAGYSATPAPVGSPVAFTTITSGLDFSCGLATDGTAYCWGSNAYGQLGNGSTTASTAPVAVSGGVRFTMLAAGGYHACGIATDTRMYCWGDNNNGETGNGGGGSTNGSGDVIVPTPTQVVGQP